MLCQKAGAYCCRMSIEVRVRGCDAALPYECQHRGKEYDHAARPNRAQCPIWWLAGSRTRRSSSRAHFVRHAQVEWGHWFFDHDRPGRPSLDMLHCYIGQSDGGVLSHLSCDRTHEGLALAIPQLKKTALNGRSDANRIWTAQGLLISPK